MRFLLFLLLSGLSSVAQRVDEYKSTADIAAMERDGHQRVVSSARQTSASNNFDIKYLRCEWEVDPAVRFIAGKVTIYFTVSVSSSSITLDLMSPLLTDSVKMHAQQLLFTQPSNSLEVNFLSNLDPGYLDSVSIWYHGVPPNTGFSSFILSTHATMPVLWTLSEPYGARDWWPCKNGLDDKADSIDIFITNPAAYKAASNGLLQSENLINTGTKKVSHWKHRYPIASYLVCLAVTNYAVFNNQVQLGSTVLPMLTYCYPENETNFQAETQNVLDALQLFHNNFGDYPFIKEKYGHVQFGWGGGMEHQTCSFIVNTNESLTSHELGHQWFGDKITCGSWQDIWLNEGFATYLARFYMENKYPLSTLNNRRAVLNNITSSTGGSVKVDDTTSVNRIFSSRLSYDKGSYLLQMLRLELGDNDFFDGLRRYQSDPLVIYGFAHTADLKRDLELESGKDLAVFFNQWYEGQGYPTYNVQWSELGSTSVKIKVSQTTSDASVSFFEMPVPLKFTNGSQEKTIIVDNKINGEIFVSNIGFIPDSVFIDPNLELISKNNTSSKIIFPFSGNATVDVFPNPIHDQFTIYMHDLTGPSADVQLFNSAGQLVFKQHVILINGAEILQPDFDKLARGGYILKVTAGDFTFTKKLLK
ncbi:MAG: M1 family aminopeptidase [Ferruginibacter sp.]